MASFSGTLVLTPNMPGGFQRVGRESSEGACPGAGLDEQGCHPWRPGVVYGSVVHAVVFMRNWWV